MNDKNKNKVWSVYFEETNQIHDSAKTARNQVPRVAKYIESLNLPQSSIVLDIGCGKHNNLFEQYILDIGLQYYGIDPFNKSMKINLHAIDICAEGKSDLVCINNVFNVIKEKHIWHSILLQAKNALKENGHLIIQVYEGVQTKEERENKIKDLKPIQTRDGWQNRLKIEKYLVEVQSVFPSAKVISSKNGKFIILDQYKKDL